MALGLDTVVVAAAAPGWLAWRARSAVVLLSVEVAAPLTGLLVAAFRGPGLPRGLHAIAAGCLLLPVVVVVTMAGGNIAGLPRATAPLLGVIFTAAAVVDQAAWGSVLVHAHLNTVVAAGAVVVQACVACAVGLFAGMVTREGWSPSGSAVSVLALFAGLGFVLLAEHTPRTG